MDGLTTRRGPYDAGVQPATRPAQSRPTSIAMPSASQGWKNAIRSPSDATAPTQRRDPEPGRHDADAARAAIARATSVAATSAPATTRHRGGVQAQPLEQPRIACGERPRGPAGCRRRGRSDERKMDRGVREQESPTRTRMTMGYLRTTVPASQAGRGPRHPSPRRGAVRPDRGGRRPTQARWRRAASRRRSSRKSGWAIAISAWARSRRLCPNSSATPHSVTTVRTWARVVTTPAPSRRLATIRDAVPPAAVEGSAMIGPALRGERRAAHEVHLAADARVERVADRVGDDLAGQVDLDRGVDRDHPAERADDVGVVREVDRPHLDHRVVVDELVQAGRAHEERRDDLAAVALLGGAGDDAGLDEVDDRVGEHLGVDPEVALVASGRARSRSGWPRSPAGASRRSGTSSATCSPIRRSTSPIDADSRGRRAGRRPRPRGRCR